MRMRARNEDEVLLLPCQSPLQCKGDSVPAKAVLRVQGLSDNHLGIKGGEDYKPLQIPSAFIKSQLGI